jgi:hypothetical protein
VSQLLWPGTPVESSYSARLLVNGLRGAARASTTPADGSGAAVASPQADSERELPETVPGLGFPGVRPRVGEELVAVG